MRIISGSARGRKLEVPTTGTRPSSDRMREAMFSSIDSHLGHIESSWADVNFVDLFAGSGAIGLEAMSRGAREVTLVENSSKTKGVIEKNAAKCGLEVKVVKANAYTWIPTSRVNILFLDPPYADSDAILQGYLAKLVQLHLLDGALVICERGARAPSPFAAIPPLTLPFEWERGYGDSKLWYGQVVSSSTI
ncbi:MAG: RsmD family RNA methyltransferase [Candidatus Nanopelagicales bacterium]